jgi:hypothetical protein
MSSTAALAADTLMTVSKAIAAIFQPETRMVFLPFESGI